MSNKNDTEASKAVAAQTGLQQPQASEVAANRGDARDPRNAPPKATNPQGRGAANNGDVADQEAADKAAQDAQDLDKDTSQPGADGRTLRTGFAASQQGGLQAGANNPQDGTPIASPTGDVTRPDATKGPLHNPGVVVEAGMQDPSPATVIAPGTVLAPTASAKRDMTDPSRKH